MKMTRSDLLQAEAKQMLETGRGGLQEKVRRLVKKVERLTGEEILYYHTHNSQHCAKGFPDVQILWEHGQGGRERGRLVVAELKRENKEPTETQWEWLRRYAHAGAEVYLWKPSHFLNGFIQEVLLFGPYGEKHGRIFNDANSY